MGQTDPAVDTVVCDTGPLIHLDELACLDLLRDFARVAVPESVWQELERHRPSILDLSRISLERMPPEAAEDPQVEAASLIFTLHQGEKEALLIMRTLPNAMLLTDDAAARLAAQSLGMKAHGTVGVMVRAIRRKMRSKGDVIGLLRSIPVRSTLFIKPTLLDEIIRQVEEA